MLQQVINLLHNNRLTEARTLCEQLNYSNKRDLDIWLLLADIYQQCGDFDKAVNSYRKIIKLKADHPSAHRCLAMLYHSKGKFAKAGRYYRQSLKLNNKQATVHFNLGAILQEQNKLDDALAQYRQAIVQQPDYAKAYANMGFIFRHQKKTDKAIDCYRKALRFAPELAQIHYNLGLSLLEAGQTEAAEQHQHQAINLKPDYAEAFAGLGAVQFFNGDIEKAENSYRQALHYQPVNTEILRGYANILSAQGQHEQALEQIKRALNIEPDNTETCIIKGFIHLSLNQHDEALDCCNQALKTAPQDEKARNLAASIYEKKGDPQQSYHYLAPLLEKKSPHVEFVLTFASISKSLNLVDNAIEYMEGLLQNSKKIAATDQSKLHFALGNAYDNQKDYKRAFKNFNIANKLKQAVFDIKDIQKNIDAQISVFSSPFYSRLKKASIRSNRPVFIVAMPRSGTSLVEQILASHPQISGAGELLDINNLALSMQQTYRLNYHYPQCLQQIDSPQLDAIAQTYLDCLSNIDNHSRHVTDKMPGNYIHLGLIQLLFPDARIIHCKRNPLDTCLSCYFQDFSQSHPWIYNLQNTGKVYLEYQRLMQHWKKVLDIPIFDVQYEDLVNNQENVSRQMIDFCGLDWDDACLQFHKNERFIWTASYDQVRQPMYKKSAGRWKNYENYITALKKLLREPLNKSG